jgi:oligoendopeptidase F
MSRGITMEGLDPIDLLKFIGRKSKKFQAVFLSELEILLEDLEPETRDYLFKSIRKLYLDNQNDFSRSTVTAIFGDVEHAIK